MIKLKAVLYFFFILAPLLAYSQITPPVFQCVRGDTLYWLPANNTCGTFISTEIYYSPDPAGPYTVIATLTDESVHSYHHPVGGGAYYYLATDADCPGMIPIYSDTLDNLPPKATTIERVTVRADGVHVKWHDNQDPKTAGYIVYRSTPQGTLPIDTVYSSLEYLDQSGDPSAKSETYYVLAVDQCGNTGLFDFAHNTIHLKAALDFCKQHIELTWNPYQNWPTGVDHIEIWLSKDGNPAEFEHRLQESDTLAYITGIDDGRTYCVTVRYIQSGNNVMSESNEVCFVADVISPLVDLAIRNVSVTDDGTVEVTWRHTADADLKYLVIDRGIRGKSSLDSLFDLRGQRPVTNEDVYMDQLASPNLEPYNYRITAIDDCDTSRRSNEMASIHLHAVAAATTSNDLQWTPFYATDRDLSNYQICRILDGTTSTVHIAEENESSFTDDLQDITTGLTCYVVKAIHTDKMGLDSLVARSNKACIKQKTNLFIPNAFAPQSINNIFKPLFATGEGVSGYQMQIFNRWGGLIFETTERNQGWNGTQDGQLLLPGAYIYSIQFDQPDGQREKYSGTVHLIR